MQTESPAVLNKNSRLCIDDLRLLVGTPQVRQCATSAVQININYFFGKENTTYAPCGRGLVVVCSPSACIRPHFKGVVAVTTR